MMIKSLRCVVAEARDLPLYDGLTSVDEFLNKFESEVPKKQRFDALKWAHGGVCINGVSRIGANVER